MNLGNNCFWVFTADCRCIILWVKHMSLSIAQLLLLHFLSVSSFWTPCGGSISWEQKPGAVCVCACVVGVGVKMEECNLHAKPGPPPELWTLYFIQHCQLTPTAPDHHHPSSPALYSTDTASLQVARLKTVWIWQKLVTGQRAEVSAVMSWGICHSWRCVLASGLGLQALELLFNKWQLMYYAWSFLRVSVRMS